MTYYIYSFSLDREFQEEFQLQTSSYSEVEREIVHKYKLNEFYGYYLVCSGTQEIQCYSELDIQNLISRSDL